MSENALRFDIDDAQRAADAWGFNCGPAAVCAVANKTPDEIRQHLGDFERKRYTNPTLMFDILQRLKIIYQQTYRSDSPIWQAGIILRHGLMRVQWGGPWTKEGVPMRVRYRHTHWVACRTVVATSWRCEARPMPKPGWPGIEVFDVNAMCVGGWLQWKEWAEELTPWLIRQCEPKADGTWWPTHCLTIESKP